MTATMEFALLAPAPDVRDNTNRGALVEASVEILDAGDALVTALGAYLDGDLGPRVEAQGMAALERWRCASDAFLSTVETELGES